MESTRPRRSSTGGRPPRKIETFMCVDLVPTHDNILCYSAWEATRTWGSQEDPAKSRSQWGLQIYDTTPDCGKDAERLERLALKLHKKTWRERGAMGRDEPDRIDLYALPMPPDTSEEDRAAKCKAHYLAEREVRNARGIRNSGHYIPQAKSYFGWEHVIMIMVQPEGHWDEGKGGFLQVMWERSENWQKNLWILPGDDEDTRVQSLTRHLYKDGEGLGKALREQRESIESFMIEHCHLKYEHDDDRGWRGFYCSCELCLPESEKRAPE